MSDSLSNKELVAVGHQFAKAMSSATPLIDMAKIVSRLAERLDCTTLALREATKQRDALAAENAGLKAGASYFSYGSEHNFECHKTAEEAVEAAEAAIDDYRGDACDGWSEEVDSVCWGIILQSSTKVGERPRTEDDRCDPAIDTICDYALLPNIKTPATDAFLAEVRASTLENLAKKKRDEKMSLHPDTFALGSVIAALDMQANELDDLATQLRQEAAQ